MSRTGGFIVTGAGSGIGLAIARKLVTQGHKVFGIGRNPKKFQVLFRGDAESFSSFAADLGESSPTKSAVQAIRTWLNDQRIPLLGLVNNAGVFDRVNFDETTDDLWDRHYKINLLAAARLTRELHAELRAAAPSSVLNISSTLGIRPVASTAAYSAMKAAMVSWTKTLALEWAGEKIRVNCICPGLVDTPIHTFHGKNETDEVRKQAHSFQPMGRMGTAEEIAEAAAFLLSEASAWTTGSILAVDGGISL